METIAQNEALGISFPVNLVSRSFEVTQGQKPRKKVKFQSFSNVGKWYLKVLTPAISCLIWFLGPPEARHFWKFDENFIFEILLQALNMI